MVATYHPAARTPWVTYITLGLTVTIYLAQWASKLLAGGIDYPAILGMKVNELILQGQLWRLFTPVLLHSTTSILHIVFNMYALYNFGPALERYFGHARFLLLYLLGGYAGNVISFFFSPAYSLGSSTAIFGLLGAEAVFLYQNRALFGQTAQRALVNIITIAAINLFIGLSPGIDNWGHLGGLVGGTLFTWFAGPVLQVEGIQPALQVVDQHGAGDALRAAIGVGGVFTLIAILKFISF